MDDRACVLNKLFPVVVFVDITPLTDFTNSRSMIREKSNVIIVFFHFVFKWTMSACFNEKQSISFSYFLSLIMVPNCFFFHWSLQKLRFYVFIPDKPMTFDVIHASSAQRLIDISKYCCRSMMIFAIEWCLSSPPLSSSS